jgi:hypothetical protein
VPELGEDRLGERFGVAARHGAKQDQLEQLIIGEGGGGDIAEASPQSRMWLAGILEAHQSCSIGE